MWRGNGQLDFAEHPAHGLIKRGGSSDRLAIDVRDDFARLELRGGRGRIALDFRDQHPFGQIGERDGCCTSRLA